ncbi:MAG: ATP synthase F1 subunit delta, partial [Selenomonadaceae bacterium]|nr:ATP synthase F1 subunit delta [Selenomonadaceae bacterium]
GRAAIWNYDYDICYQNHVSRLRPKSEDIDNSYFLYLMMIYKEQGILIADVTSAFPLSKKQQDALVRKLGNLTGRKVKVRTHKDESILGGLIVKIGDKRIDGSAAGRLRSLRNSLSVNSGGV